jgi:hypothetical protein
LSIALPRSCGRELMVLVEVLGASGGSKDAMCRISAVSEDWVGKGCHVHVASVELALRPDHLGGIVFRPVFSSPDVWAIDAAARLVEAKLDDDFWRNKLKDTIERAMTHLMGVQGPFYDLARGRLFELRMLVIALERWERK